MVVTSKGLIVARLIPPKTVLLPSRDTAPRASAGFCGFPEWHSQFPHAEERVRQRLTLPGLRLNHLAPTDAISRAGRGRPSPSSSASFLSRKTLPAIGLDWALLMRWHWSGTCSRFAYLPYDRFHSAWWRAARDVPWKPRRWSAALAIIDPAGVARTRPRHDLVSAACCGLSVRRTFRSPDGQLFALPSMVRPVRAGDRRRVRSLHCAAQEPVRTRRSASATRLMIFNCSIAPLLDAADDARFLLAGIVNRMDRAYVVAGKAAAKSG